MSNRIIHFEIHSVNPEATKKFFKNVFNWAFNRYNGQDYWLTASEEENLPGIDGGLMKSPIPHNNTINFIDVDDIDITIEDIKSNGGTISVQKTAIPSLGWMTHFIDPAGYLCGVFQADANAE